MVVASLLLLSAVPFAVAYPWAAQSASSFAGATSTDVFPPPGATITADETYFPDAEQVGFAGPTPSKYRASSRVVAVLILYTILQLARSLRPFRLPRSHRSRQTSTL